MADIVTTTAGTAGSIGSTAAELINDLRAQTLRVAEYAFVEEQFARKEVIRNAKTAQWNRVERLPVAATPAVASETDTPEAVGLEINSVTATLEIYDTLVTISALAQLTARHNLVQGTIRTIGRWLGETRSHVIYNILNASTNAFRINDRANDNALAVGDKTSYNEVTQMMSSLANAGASVWADGKYNCILPPFLYNSLLNDADWKARHQFDKPEYIDHGYVGGLGGVNVVHTNSTAYTSTASTTSGNSSKIYTGFVFGEEWFAVTDLQSVRIFVNKPGSGTDLGHKKWSIYGGFTMKSVILNQAFGVRLRASGSNATAVA